MTTRKKDLPPKPGPQAETLKIEGDWKEAVGHALRRGKPPAEATKKKKGKS